METDDWPVTGEDPGIGLDSILDRLNDIAEPPFDYINYARRAADITDVNGVKHTVGVRNIGRPQLDAETGHYRTYLKSHDKAIMVGGAALLSIARRPPRRLG